MLKTSTRVLMALLLLLGWPGPARAVDGDARSTVAPAAPSLTPGQTPAAAGPSSADRAAALAATREGNRLLDAGRAEEALARFKEAHRLVGGDKLRYNMGQALRAIPGRELEAYTEFDTFLARVPGAAPELAQAAAAERDALRGMLGFVSVTTDPPGAEMTVDGLPRGPTPLPDAVAVRPGRHHLQLALSGYQTVQDTLVLRPGQRLEQRYSLAPAALSAGGAAPVTAAVAPPPAEPPGLLSVQAPAAVANDPKWDDGPPALLRRWWFWAAVGGAAVVALGVVALASGGSSTMFVCPGGVNACQGIP